MSGTFFEDAWRSAAGSPFAESVGETLRDARVGETLKEAAVTVTALGIRGYRWLEPELEKLGAALSDIFAEAEQRADEPPASRADRMADDDLLTDPATGESVVSEAESYLRKNGPDEKS